MIACLEMAKEISIHTPTKGVTVLDTKVSYQSCISIHTPTKGVTPQFGQAEAFSEFQSTLPRRE